MLTDELASRKNDVSELKKENVALHNEIKELKVDFNLRLTILSGYNMHFFPKNLVQI